MMFGRMSMTVVLLGSALLVSGCGRLSQGKKRPRDEVPASPNAKQITLHVAGMTTKQHLV